MIGNKQHYLIAGATGLIGSKLLEMLLVDEKVGKVTLLTRRPVERVHPKIAEKIIDFETFTEREIAPNIDAVFCCLGTTLAQAGSKAAFRKVDYEYVVKLAVFTQRQGIPQFHVVSAANANFRSWVFYSKVKGRMERQVKKLNKIRSIYIYRPSMLLGDRPQFRLAETLGKILMKTFSFMLPKSTRAVDASEVAHAMFNKAKSPKKGVHKVLNAEMLLE